MLGIRNLSYFLADQQLIKNFSQEFQPGRLYSILGPNGSGKSTLLKIITAILPAPPRSLFWKENSLDNFSRRQRAALISIVPQNPKLGFDFNVSELVSMSSYARLDRLNRQAEDLFLREVLEMTDLWPLRMRQLDNLSGGERQRVYLARALFADTPILLLDEPSAFLDVGHCLLIWHLLQELTKRGKLVITTTHEIDSATRFCDETILLYGGKNSVFTKVKNEVRSRLLAEAFSVRENHLRASPHFERI